MEASISKAVRRRAGNRCEYCGLHQDESPLATLHIEHIKPRKHGGADDLDNLALACIDCNLRKGSNIAGYDPKTGKLTLLFNPRTHRWRDHFHWDGAFITGRTALGRTTVEILDLNSDEQLELRIARQ